MSKRGGFPGMGGFGGMNINQLMKEAKKMQADMEKSQEELANKEFDSTAGGILKTNSNSFIGHSVLDYLNYFVSDISFVSFPCINPEFGLGDNTMEDLKIRDTMLKRSKLRILLADHTKLEDVSATVFSKTLNIDTVITDKKINKKWNEFFKKEGINVKF